MILNDINAELLNVTILIIVVLHITMIMIRYVKGGKITLFNFKKHYKDATKRNNLRRISSGDTTLIGVSYKQPVYIPNNAKHIFVCGTTGSGKTVALANFIKSGIDFDYPMLIIDEKGDTDAGSILDITKKLAGNKKLYIINLNAPEKSDKYNPFNDTDPDIIKDMLVNMTNWSEEHYKYNVERYIQKLCSMLDLLEIKISFGELIQYLPANAFIELSKRLHAMKLITKEEHLQNTELAKASSPIIEGATARFSTVKESKIGDILSGDGIDIYTALRQNSIILFILNPLLYPEISPLFGKLIIIDSKKAVSKFYLNKKNRIFYIFDEINTYASTNLLDLVNKSRSANITCILATQSLADLNTVSQDFKEQIIENTNNYIVLRQNSATNAESWANIFGTRKTMEATYQINDGTPTNLGTLKRTREYIYHPDDIKTLQLGEAIFLSRDENNHCTININKPF